MSLEAAYRRTAFEAHNAYASVAIPSGTAVCAKDGCGALKALDGNTLLRCSKCHVKFFCSREHQLEAWPQHKSFCKKLANCQPRDTAALQNVVQDFVVIHKRPILEALARKVYSIDHFDERSLFARWELQTRPDAKGNPASAFTLTLACIVPTMAYPGVACSDDYATDPLWDQSTTSRIGAHEVNLKKKQASLEDVCCQFFVDGRAALTTFETICLSLFLSPAPCAGLPWYHDAQQLIQTGIVRRLVGEHEQDQSDWAMGLLEKRGTRWIWRHHTQEQFMQKGFFTMFPNDGSPLAKFRR